MEPKIIKREIFETSDGETFESLDEAIDHEFVRKVIEEIQPVIQNDISFADMDDMAPADFAKWIAMNKAAIKRAFEVGDKYINNITTVKE